jgi:hypothetical protein
MKRLGKESGWFIIFRKEQMLVNCSMKRLISAAGGLHQLTVSFAGSLTTGSLPNIFKFLEEDTRFLPFSMPRNLVKYGTVQFTKARLLPLEKRTEHVTYNSPFF